MAPLYCPYIKRRRRLLLLYRWNSRRLLRWTALVVLVLVKVPSRWHMAVKLTPEFLLLSSWRRLRVETNLL